MEIYVGVTDYDWYKHLSESNSIEANFWRPGSTPFRRLSPGELFLFKLKSPHNRIVGGGHFLRYLQMPISLAWNTYGELNGVNDPFEFKRRIYSLLPNKRQDVDPEIGCILLAECFWFGYDSAIEVPKNWKANIVQGRGYNLFEEEGQLLYNVVSQRSELKTITTVAEPISAYGGTYENRARLGQAGFRALTIENYERRCAVTGERTLPVLEASHIQPYSIAKKHEIRNGLLLRADLHRLFDDGFVTITEEYNVEVSSAIKDRWQNGHEYYEMHGNQLMVLPQQINERPSKELLRWHNENVYEKW